MKLLDSLAFVVMLLFRVLWVINSSINSLTEWNINNKRERISLSNLDSKFSVFQLNF